MKSLRAGLPFIFVTLLIDIAGFGLIIPVLPRLVTQLSGGRAHTGAVYLGLLLSSFGLMQFLFSPILGALSDRYGRRPVLLTSLVFTSLDYVIMAVAPSVGWLFVGRLLAGITGASFTVASAYIADVTPPEKRAAGFGLIGAAFGVGFILGPAAGGLLGEYGARLPFWVAAATALINFAYGLLVLPESLAVENRRSSPIGFPNPLREMRVLARYRWVVLMAGSVGFLGLAQQALQSTWVLYTTYRYNWSPVANGLALALIGLMAGLVQATLTGFAVPRLGERRTVLWSIVIDAMGYIFFAMATRTWMMVVIIVFWSLSGLGSPTISSLISNQYGPDEQGSVQGAPTSLQSLSGIVGPLLFTSLFGYFTAPTAPIISPGMPFFAGAGLIVIGGILARRALSQRQTSPSEAEFNPV